MNNKNIKKDNQQEKIKNVGSYGKVLSKPDTVSVSGYVISENDFRYDLPDELSSANKNSTFFKMGLNSTIASVLNLYSSLLLTISWKVQKPDNADISDEIVDFYQSVIDNIEGTWYSFVEEASTVLQYGWCAFEIVLKKRLDGKIGIKELVYIPQRTLKKWEVDKNGNIIGLVQYGNSFNNFKDIVIPKEKMLLITGVGANGSPEGKSILLGAFEDWKTFQLSESVLRITMKRGFVGMPILRIPKEIIEAANSDDGSIQYSPVQRGAAKKSYKSFQELLSKLSNSRESGVILPSTPYKNENGSYSSAPLFDLELLSLSGQPLVDINTVRDSTEARMARVMQGDFLQMGTSGTGAYSLGNTRYEMFARSVNVVADKILTEVNRILFKVIAYFNMINDKDIPILTHTEANQMSIKDMIDNIAQYSFAGGGILPDENVDKEIRKKLELPQNIQRPKDYLSEHEIKKIELENSINSSSSATSSSSSGGMQKNEGGGVSSTGRATQGKKIDDTTKKTRPSSD